MGKEACVTPLRRRSSIRRVGRRAPCVSRRHQGRVSRRGYRSARVTPSCDPARGRVSHRRPHHQGKVGRPTAGPRRQDPFTPPTTPPAPRYTPHDPQFTNTATEPERVATGICGGMGYRTYAVKDPLWTPLTPSSALYGDYTPTPQGVISVLSCLRSTIGNTGANNGVCRRVRRWRRRRRRRVALPIPQTPVDVVVGRRAYRNPKSTATQTLHPVLQTPTSHMPGPGGVRGLRISQSPHGATSPPKGLGVETPVILAEGTAGGAM